MSYFVMDLDHLGTDKSMIVSKIVNFGSTSRLLEEIAKCEPVCANCHRWRTWRRAQSTEPANPPLS